jgi:hypothetical protein
MEGIVLNKFLFNISKEGDGQTHVNGRLKTHALLNLGFEHSSVFIYCT